MSGDKVPFLFTLDVHDREKLKDKMNVSLDVMGEAGIKATYFVVANLIEKHDLGDVLRRMVAEGHQVASHSLTHEEPEDCKEDPVEVQKVYLKKARDILEQEIGREVSTFRAPAFRLSWRTMVALEETGHRADVSINSQRLPLFSSDLLNTGWYYAPRQPYHPSSKNPHRRGDLGLWEIPVTSFVFPFMSRLYSYFNMASAKAFTRMMEFEARHSKGKPLVYMTHPEEFYPAHDVEERIGVDWKLLVPYRRRGFLLRILFQTRDQWELYQRTMAMNDFLTEGDRLEFLTCDEYLDRHEAKAAA